MENLQSSTLIREERERAGLSLTQLSLKTGIPISTLSRYQNGGDVPASALQKIAAVLELPISALMLRREMPEDGKLTYAQIDLQRQALQQQNLFLAFRYESLHRAHRLLSFVCLLLMLFLLYVLIDRFGFPNAGLFHEG